MVLHAWLLLPLLNHYVLTGIPMLMLLSNPHLCFIYILIYDYFLSAIFIVKQERTKRTNIKNYENDFFYLRKLRFDSFSSILHSRYEFQCARVRQEYPLKHNCCHRFVAIETSKFSIRKYISTIRAKNYTGNCNDWGPFQGVTTYIVVYRNTGLVFVSNYKYGCSGLAAVMNMGVNIMIFMHQIQIWEPNLTKIINLKSSFQYYKSGSCFGSFGGILLPKQSGRLRPQVGIPGLPS